MPPPSPFNFDESYNPSIVASGTGGGFEGSPLNERGALVAPANPAWQANLYFVGYGNAAGDGFNTVIAADSPGDGPFPPSNATYYPGVTTLPIFTGTVGTRTSGVYGPQWAYLAETYNYPPGTSLEYVGSNPTAVWLYNAAQVAGTYSASLNLYGFGSPYPAQFPTGFTPSIHAYISLANDGTGLQPVGSNASLTSHAFGSFTYWTMATLNYSFDSILVLGTGAGFYTYIKFVGLPTGSIAAYPSPGGYFDWQGSLILP
jgi:hypothetical protein